MRLSVCLITRNEEHCVGRAIESVRPVADEIIVTDTGSTDRTCEIARAAGAQVHHFAWQDDFSAARNFCFAQASGDWCMGLDADERLLAESREELRRCLGRKDALGFFVRLRNELDEAEPTRIGEMTSLRLLRRIPGVRFVGRIHEQLSPPLPELAQREQKAILHSGITLQHQGFTKQKSLAKLQRAAHLLKLELQDRPGQLYHLIEYGRTLLQLGNLENGRRILVEAAGQIRPHTQDLRAPIPLVALLLELLIAAPEGVAPISPAEAIELAGHWFPRNPPLFWAAARRAFTGNRFDEAATHLERLVEMGRTGDYDRTLSFDPRILGEEPMLNLGVCYVQLGRIEDARGMFRRLADHPRVGLQAKQNLAVIEGLR